MPDLAGAMEAIESKLSTEWTSTGIGFVNGPAPIKSSDGVLVPWLFCEIEVDEGLTIGMGTPQKHVNRDYGEIVITSFAPAGEGRTVARANAVAAGEIFRHKTFYDGTPGFYVRTAKPTPGRVERAQSENPDGNWWAFTVTIPFEFYSIA